MEGSPEALLLPEAARLACELDALLQRELQKDPQFRDEHLPANRLQLAATALLQLEARLCERRLQELRPPQRHSWSRSNPRARSRPSLVPTTAAAPPAAAAAAMPSSNAWRGAGASVTPAQRMHADIPSTLFCPICVTLMCCATPAERAGAGCCPVRRAGSAQGSSRG